MVGGSGASGSGQVQAVEFGADLGPRVEHRLAAPPVVVHSPVAADLFHLGERYALGPVVGGLGVGPAGLAQAALELIQVILGDSDREACDGVAHGVLGPGRRPVEELGSRERFDGEAFAVP